MRWQTMPVFPAEFKASFPEYDDIILQLLYNRGLKTAEEIASFLNPDYPTRKLDPFRFRRMEEAVDLIIKHVKAGHKITVYGDYDADGVTSSAVLKEILELFKADVEVYIPDRVSEGYGVNAKAVSCIRESGSKLVITVDCGIRSRAEIAEAIAAGLDIIVTDHHVGPEDPADMPDCIVIDPMIEGETYPFRYLAGVGVAFKLAVALIQKSKLSDPDKEKLEERILDLVAIGTVADCVRLTGENRVLVKKGLEVLNKTKRVGLKEVFRIAQLDSNKKLDSWNIGFQIGPRLNAAGRLEHANTAYEILVTKDKKEAEMLASHLNNKNVDRQDITEIIFKEIDASVKKDKDGEPVDYILIGVSESEGADWNEGVVGLVAGRLCEKYHRPALVITRTEDGYKGSGRSIDGYSIIAKIEECSELLTRYGGHAAACGFSLETANISRFKEKISALVASDLSQMDLSKKLLIETELDLAQVDEGLHKKIDMFAPYGEGNDRPNFLSKGLAVVDMMKLGNSGQHLKLRLKTGESRVWSALAFNRAKEWADLNYGDTVDVVYYLEMNEFNGRRDLEMRIVDLKIIHN